MNKKWLARLKELTLYKARFGTCDVKNWRNGKYEALMKWVCYQRYQGGRGDLKPEQTARLNALGFLWKSPSRRGGYIPVSDEELLEELRRLHGELNRIPGAREMTEYGRYSAARYQMRFGGFKNARQKAGFGKFHLKQISERELLDDLLRLHKMLHKTPSARDIEVHGKYSFSTYKLRFREIKQAREKAGLPGEIKTRITNQELLDDLRRMHDELKRLPGKEDINKRGKCSVSLYCQRFKGLLNAREKAGLGRERIKTKSISESALLNDLRRLQTKLKRTPTDADVRHYGRYNSATYQVRFGGISLAREKAGLKKKTIEKLPDQALLDDLNSLHKKLKRAPHWKDVKKYGKYDDSLYSYRFGGVKKALIKAGIREQL